MPPPDLPARPAPKASLTDVVPRRTLVVLAVVVALAVLGTVLAFALGGDEGTKGAGGGDRPAATASGETRQDENGGTDRDGATGPDGSAGPGATDSEDGTPGASDGAGAGSGDGGKDGAKDGSAKGDEGAATTHKGSQGYTIGLPEGWAFRSSGAAGDRFTGPGGQKLLVAWTSTPKGDPVADWKNQERYMVRPSTRRSASRRSASAAGTRPTGSSPTSTAAPSTAPSTGASW